MEWCQDTSSDYPEASPDSPIEDADRNLTITSDVLRPVRGGAFLYQPSNARASHRDNNRFPDNPYVSPYLGFRIARTIRNKP